jgi:prephenate dehydrogenase
MLAQLSILAPVLLGASVARAARARNVASRIVIWTRRPETRAELAGQPWCDEASDDPGRAVTGATLVVIAAPVDQIPALTRQIAPCLRSDAIVTDVGSVKGEISRLCAAALGSSAHFVGSHPMAGSEKTGWMHGTEKLFEGRTCFVTPLAATDARATETVVQFWRDLGGKPAVVDPDRHDEIVAHISHLPQVIASTLCAFLATKDATWGSYAGGGLRDTTRIAGSDPELWRTILEQNRDEILRALDEYENTLHRFRAALANKDYAAITHEMKRAQDYRRGLQPPA